MMTDVEILRAACCLAGMDDNVDDRELVMLQKLAFKAGVGKISLEAMIQRARSDPNFYEELFKYLRTDAEATMRVLLCVAAADNDVSADQRIIMGIFAQRLGMDPQHYDHLVTAVQKAVSKRVAGQKK